MALLFPFLIHLVSRNVLLTRFMFSFKKPPNLTARLESGGMVFVSDSDTKYWNW